MLPLSVPSGICTPPFFNAEAGTRDQCVRCFCFDQATDCVSSSLFKSEVRNDINNESNNKELSHISKFKSTSVEVR